MLGQVADPGKRNLQILRGPGKNPAAWSCYRLTSGRAISSIAAALRWRAFGRCASQQATEQNKSFTRPELQVETEQRKNLLFIAIGFRHIEQTANGELICAV